MVICILSRKWKLKPLDKLENHPALFSHSSLATVRGLLHQVLTTFASSRWLGSASDLPVVFRFVLSCLLKLVDPPTDHLLAGSQASHEHAASAHAISYVTRHQAFRRRRH